MKHLLCRTGSAAACLLLCCLLAGACSRSSVACSQMRLLTDGAYYPEVRRLIADAKHSVRVVMFEASYYRKYPSSPSNKLIDALADAAKRGLQVEVILENGNEDERTTRRNLETARILKSAGAAVFLDPQDITTHAKMLIIDKQTVILGSTNWTYPALTKNHEVAAALHDQDAAKVLWDYFDGIKKTGKKL
ncbi:phospholipase D-like domain-containing protein [Thermodesulfobacteriota bacterium]